MLCWPSETQEKCCSSLSLSFSLLWMVLVGAVGLDVAGLLALVAQTISTRLLMWAALGGMTTLTT
jgi:hypothetical protein